MLVHLIPEAETSLAAGAASLAGGCAAGAATNGTAPAPSGLSTPALDAQGRPQVLGWAF